MHLLGRIPKLKEDRCEHGMSDSTIGRHPKDGISSCGDVIVIAVFATLAEVNSHVDEPYGGACAAAFTVQEAELRVSTWSIVVRGQSLLHT